MADSLQGSGLFATALPTLGRGCMLPYQICAIVVLPLIDAEDVLQSRMYAFELARSAAAESLNAGKRTKKMCVERMC